MIGKHGKSPIGATFQNGTVRGHRGFILIDQECQEIYSFQAIISFHHVW